MLDSYYSKDLLIDPKTRGVYDIAHEVVAIGSSSSLESAQRFAKEVGTQGAKLYGAYEDLIKDPNVDIVYVASSVSPILFIQRTQLRKQPTLPSLPSC